MPSSSSFISPSEPANASIKNAIRRADLLLQTGKPHIYFSPIFGDWVAVFPTGLRLQTKNRADLFYKLRARKGEDKTVEKVLQVVQKTREAISSSRPFLPKLRT